MDFSTLKDFSRWREEKPNLCGHNGNICVFHLQEEQFHFGFRNVRTAQYNAKINSKTARFPALKMMQFENNEAEAPGWPQMRSRQVGRTLGLILGSTKPFSGHPPVDPAAGFEVDFGGRPHDAQLELPQASQPWRKMVFQSSVDAEGSGSCPVWARARPAPRLAPVPAEFALCFLTSPCAGCWFSLAGGGRFAASLALPRPPHP